MPDGEDEEIEGERDAPETLEEVKEAVRRSRQEIKETRQEQKIQDRRHTAYPHSIPNQQLQIR